MSIDAEAPASSMPSLKRPHPDNEATNDPSTPIDMRDDSPSPQSSALSTPADMATPKDTPDASTNAGSTCTSPSRTATQQGSLTATTSGMPRPTPQSSSAPPAKRRRLTPAEKLEEAAKKEAAKLAKEDEKRKKQEEKELKERLKEDEKKAKEAAKEEEKQAKEEKKRLEQEAKDEEKRKKTAERDAEKALKDFKKQEKEKEIKLREASQLRLSSFFAVPKSSPVAPIPKTLKASASPTKANFITKDEARRRSMSLDPVDFDPPTPTKSKHVISDSNKQAKQHNSQDKGFLPFVLGKNARLAPINAFLPAEDELVRVNASMDGFIGRKQQEPSPSVQECFVRERVQRGFQPPRVAKVVQKLQGSSNAPIDLTQDSRNKPMDELRAIPLKYFFYGEDVRPPYKGTWTRPVDSRTARKLALKPLAQVLPEVVYDYDSEAEWDDAEEGEDIDIEDGDDEEDVEDEETEDFIDDDNAPQYLARRGLPANDVEPICSGLQWQDANGKLKSADPRYADADFKEFEVCFLLDPSPSTIDPFTTAYWEPEPKKAPVTPLTSSMGPPRLPLSDRTNGQGTIQATLVNGKVPKAAKVGPRLVPADVLPAFRAAVDGSDMTKIALIEALKKQFPKLGKAQIQDTLPLIAHRVGAKQSEKKWQLIAEAKG